MSSHGGRYGDGPESRPMYPRVSRPPPLNHAAPPLSYSPLDVGGAQLPAARPSLAPEAHRGEVQSLTKPPADAASGQGQPSSAPWWPPRRETPVRPPQWASRSGAGMDDPPQRLGPSGPVPNGNASSEAKPWSFEKTLHKTSSPSSTEAASDDTTVEDIDDPEPAQIRSDILSPEKPPMASKVLKGGPAGARVKPAGPSSGQPSGHMSKRPVSAEGNTLDKASQRPRSAGSGSASTGDSNPRPATRMPQRVITPVPPPRRPLSHVSSPLALGKSPTKARGGEASIGGADDPYSVKSIKRAFFEDSSDSDSPQPVPLAKRFKMPRSRGRDVSRSIPSTAHATPHLASSPPPASGGTGIGRSVRGEEEKVESVEKEPEEDNAYISDPNSSSDSDEDIPNVPAKFLPQRSIPRQEEEDDVDAEETGSPREDDATLVEDANPGPMGDSRAERRRGGQPTAILMAEPGRPYREFELEEGQLVSAMGAVIPANYEFSDLPEHPWVCTVRNCRRAFTGMQGLGKHFGGTHRGLHFNDNGDGTLSVVGAPPSFANERSIVVSQRSRSQEEMEPLAECIPHKKAVAPRPSLPTEHKETTDPSATAGSSSPAQGDPQAMMRYLRPHLHQTNLDQAFKSYHVEICLALPRVRDVVWNKDRLEKAPFKDTLPRDISSMIIQLTGDYAAKPCDHCVDRRGPYEGCVLIRPDAPLEMQKIITSCANCRYKGQASHCSLIPWMKARFDRLFPEAKGQAVGGPVGKRTDRKLAAEAVGSEPRADDQGKRAPASASRNVVRRSERMVIRESLVLQSDEMPANASRNSKGWSTDHESDTKAIGRRSGTNRSGAATPSSRGVSRTSPQLGMAGPSMTGQGFSAEQLVMEEWEIAPGHIRRGGEPLENMAYSSAFLTSTQQVPIDRGVSFRVQPILPGCTITFEADQSRRWWSVTTGKVTVRPKGEEPFVLGPNGLFILRPGDSCVVTNRYCVSAVLHISAVRNLS